MVMDRVPACWKLKLVLKMETIQPFESLFEFKDPLTTMRALLSYPLSGFTYRYFTITRDFSSCLYFVDYCYSIIENNLNVISESEFEKLDKHLIWYRLFALDHLNYWETYLAFFEETLREKGYFITYDKNCKPEDFGQYFKGVSDENQKLLIHFLYNEDYRYQIIKRKRERQLQGKKLGNVYRHQKDQLSEEEQKRRLNELLQLFECMTKGNA